MSTPLSHEALTLLVERTLYQLLAQLPPGWPPNPLNVDARSHGTVATLRLGPPSAMPVVLPQLDDLTPREREVLDAIRLEVDRLGRRVIGREVRHALILAGTKWSASTVNQALASLVDRGLLVNDNDKRGYGLATDPAPF